MQVLAPVFVPGYVDLGKQFLVTWLPDSSQLSLALQSPGKVLTLLGKYTRENIQSKWRNPITPSKLPKRKCGGLDIATNSQEYTSY